MTRKYACVVRVCFCISAGFIARHCLSTPYHFHSPYVALILLFIFLSIRLWWIIVLNSIMIMTTGTFNLAFIIQYSIYSNNDSDWSQAKCSLCIARKIVGICCYVWPCMESLWSHYLWGSCLWWGIKLPHYCWMVRVFIGVYCVSLTQALQALLSSLASLTCTHFIPYMHNNALFFCIGAMMNNTSHTLTENAIHRNYEFSCSRSLPDGNNR